MTSEQKVFNIIDSMISMLDIELDILPEPIIDPDPIENAMEIDEYEDDMMDLVIFTCPACLAGEGNQESHMIGPEYCMWEESDSEIDHELQLEIAAMIGEEFE